MIFCEIFVVKVMAKSWKLGSLHVKERGCGSSETSVMLAKTLFAAWIWIHDGGRQVFEKAET